MTNRVFSLDKRKNVSGFRMHGLHPVASRPRWVCVVVVMRYRLTAPRSPPFSTCRDRDRTRLSLASAANARPLHSA